MADDLYDKLLSDLREAKDDGENYQTAKSRLWQSVLEDDQRYLKMLFNNWFNHNWSRKTDEPSRPITERRTPKPYSPRQQPTAEELRERRKEDARIKGLCLMNMFLSDGETRLKDATGKQVREEAGWLQLIAKHVKPTEVVGRKLTAEQLYNLKQQGSGTKLKLVA